MNFTYSEKKHIKKIVRDEISKHDFSRYITNLMLGNELISKSEIKNIVNSSINYKFNDIQNNIPHLVSTNVSNILISNSNIMNVVDEQIKNHQLNIQQLLHDNNIQIIQQKEKIETLHSNKMAETNELLQINCDRIINNILHDNKNSVILHNMKEEVSSDMLLKFQKEIKNDLKSEMFNKIFYPAVICSSIISGAVMWGIKTYISK